MHSVIMLLYTVVNNSLYKLGHLTDKLVYK